MASDRPQARHWCWTLNNPQDGELDKLLASRQHSYIVYQLEEGEQTRTPHYQGYVQFKRKIRLSALKKFCHRIHWVISRGTPTEARDYCRKAETRIGESVEFGEFDPTPQGGRSDLLELQSAIDARNLQLHEYATEFFPLFARYPNLLQRYQMAKIKPRTGQEEVKAWLLLGEPGAGKSRYARVTGRQWAYELGGSGGLDGIYFHDLGQWFDGYRGQRVVCFEDFRGSSCSFTTFKRLLDRGPLQMGVKGSSCTVAATHFLISAQYGPDTWWKEEVVGARDRGAIYRRISKVLFFPGPLGEFISYSSYRDYALVHETPHHGQEAPIPQEVQKVCFEELEAEMDRKEQEKKAIQPGHESDHDSDLEERL